MGKSIINNDQEVARGRKNAMKDDVEQEVIVSVSKRDQIVKKLLKKSRDMKLGQSVAELWETGNADRSEWLQRQQMFLQDYDEFLESTAEGPFEQSSSLHLPTTFIVIKTMHARFLQALLGIDPPFQVKPKNDASAERAITVQQVMQYMVEHDMNERSGAFETLDLWVWQWVATGSSFIKPHWKRKFIRYQDVQPTPVAAAPMISRDKNGNEIVEEQMRIEEKEVVRMEKLWEGIQLDYIYPEDVLVIGGSGDTEKADAVIQREFLTASELYEMVDQKIFDKKAVDAVILSGQYEKDADSKQQRKVNSGEYGIGSPTELDRYEILESYIKVDIDGSGINSDVVLWVHPHTREILRATYLHRINKNGKCPIKKIDFFRRPEQQYGMGLAEVLHPLSTEMDAMHNMRVDFGLMATMPFGFYRPTSSIDPDVIQLEPGALIPVDNPQTDVVFPQLGNKWSYGFQEEAALQQLVERLTGISDLSLGVLSGNQGATRTATGARALIGEMSANLDVFLRRLNLGWKKVLMHCLDLVQQKLPVGYSYRITSSDNSVYWNTVRSREDIRGDFDMEISPNSSSSNQQVLEQRANEILQLTANPLDIQLGIVTPLERYEAIRNALVVRGIKDASRFVRKPQGISIALTPEEEANRVMAGIEVAVTPDMDHAGFIQWAQNFMKEDELMGQLSQDEAVLLQAQMQKHMQMIQAMQNMAAQQNNRQQMQQNQAAASAPTSAGQNPLGRGV